MILGVRMIKNYLKVTLRNMRKHKGYSFINIFGLALGMACCILLLLWVQDELSYDTFHENAGDLYRVVENQHYTDYIYRVAVTPYPLGPALKEDFPEIADATRYAYAGGILVRYGDNAFFENGIQAVDPSFFRMFSFPFMQGDRNTALDDPYAVVISAKMADKYFAGENPVGKSLSFNNRYDFTVTGVMKNIPRNSSLQFDMAVPFEFMKTTGRYNESWGSNSISTYVLLQKNTPKLRVDEKIAGFIKAHLEESVTTLYLQPFTRMHLYSSFYSQTGPGDIQYVYIFSVIALFILLIACINFMNLATARSANRAKEVGLRKVVGAMRGNIIRQFFSESLLLSVIALLLAVVMVALILPPFNTFSGKEISFAFAGKRPILLGLTAITLFTGIISGSYPALFLSSFQPVLVLKGSLKAGSKSAVLRKTLVVIQFSLSIFLIIGTAVIYTQLDYMRNKKPGYDKENLVYIPLRGTTRQSYRVFKSELLKNPGIAAVSASTHRPTNIGSNTSGIRWDGKAEDQKELISFSAVDFDYVETLKIELAEGRSFSEEFPSDTAAAFMVNEEVVKLMGVESAAGRNLYWGDTEGKIIGVMKNFHFQRVKYKIEPLVIGISLPDLNFILIRIHPDNTAAALDYIETTWKNVIPDYPFEYHFLSEDFERMYRTEEKIGDLLKYFSFLAVLIACLGLFGLASFTAEQRTKEIGIRKSFGASGLNVSLLFCREFFMLVIFANAIAWPFAYFAMHRWLQDFSYRTDLGLWLFALAGLLAVVIALMTVSFQSIKAALANPADALRYE